MAIMWSGSLLPNIDPNGAPYSGLKAYFFDAGTTTPRTVYRDSDLGESHDHPVVANASGKFPAVFLPAGDYRLRIEDANGVTLDDVDGISTPSTGDSGGGGGGDTPVELLFRTGMYADRHGTGTMSGWVRANGRTIGNASSGAAERANADCEDLFLFLWDQDSTLAVSGGRGANAASDWAAAKTIALPDIRLRVRMGMAGMGNTSSTLIPAADFDGDEDGDDLGATIGAGSVTLTAAQMPSHTHTGTAQTAGSHSHTVDDSDVGGSDDASVMTGGSFDRRTLTRTTSTSGAHSHTLSVNSAGSGEAHPNVQPSVAVTVYVKL
jgi:microcystin-dependent protein